MIVKIAVFLILQLVATSGSLGIKTFKNTKTGKCLAAYDPSGGTEVDLYVVPCDDSPAQQWLLRNTGDFVGIENEKSKTCLTVNPNESDVGVLPCSDDKFQKWTINGQTIKNSLGKCLRHKEGDSVAYMAPCNGGSANQKWIN